MTRTLSRLGRNRLRPKFSVVRLEELECRNLMAVLPSASAAALVDDAYENNDTRSTSTDLGTVTASRTVSNLVLADGANWYRFSRSARGTTSDSVSISFLNSQGNLDLRLYNANGSRLRGSTGTGNSEQISLSGLAAGTYYVRVNGRTSSTTNPSYSLNFNAGSGTTTPIVDDAYEDNDTFTAARNLGTLSAVNTTSNLVLADTNDWFRFTMSGTGTASDYASISFVNNQGNLDLELLNSSGTRVGLSASASNTERISLSGLSAGTYYVHVYSASGAQNANYSLQIDPAAAATTPTAPTTPTTPSTGSFDIQFTFSGLTASQQAIFDQAAAKWESIIVGDLPSATYNGVAIDDILIGASATSIDGAGNILGQAGPDRLRSGSSLPYHGIMQFDSADMAQMQANGTLLGVILHEMGHVLGVGTIWDRKGLVAGAGTSSSRFTGAQAVAAYNSIFGTNATGVPLETGGGSGTRDSHWSESLFDKELMTGYVDTGGMPLSRITVASLADIGYSVNIAAADAYTPRTTSSSIASLSRSTSSTASLRSETSVVDAGINLSTTGVAQVGDEEAVAEACDPDFDMTNTGVAEAAHSWTQATSSRTDDLASYLRRRGLASAVDQVFADDLFLMTSLA